MIFVYLTLAVIAIDVILWCSFIKKAERIRDRKDFTLRVRIVNMTKRLLDSIRKFPGIVTRRLTIFLVRKRLGLKLREPFQFVGQKSNAFYYFAEDAVMKAWRGNVEKSGVSLNWLLDADCEIRKVAHMDKEGLK